MEEGVEVEEDDNSSIGEAAAVVGSFLGLMVSNADLVCLFASFGILIRYAISKLKIQSFYLMKKLPCCLSMPGKV